MGSPVPDALVRAAERLFAERGSDQVSLREITAEAGATNASAVQYHFGDRRGLIRAVLAKHDAEVERRRHAVLDEYEAAGAGDIRLLAHDPRPATGPTSSATTTVASATCSSCRTCSTDRTRRTSRVPPRTRRTASNRWRALVVPLLTPEAIRLHRRFDALRFTVSELARRGRTGRKDHRLFTSQLTDLVTGLLLTPVSEETRRLLR